MANSTVQVLQVLTFNTFAHLPLVKNFVSISQWVYCRHHQEENGNILASNSHSFLWCLIWCHHLLQLVEEHTINKHVDIRRAFVSSRLISSARNFQETKSQELH